MTLPLSKCAKRENAAGGRRGVSEEEWESLEKFVF